jgi:hypothetical protein
MTMPVRTSVVLNAKLLKTEFTAANETSSTLLIEIATGEVFFDKDVLLVLSEPEPPQAVNNHSLPIIE